MLANAVGGVRNARQPKAAKNARDEGIMNPISAVDEVPDQEH
jgi:hypothetical protein